MIAPENNYSTYLSSEPEEFRREILGVPYTPDCCPFCESLLNFKSVKYNISGMSKWSCPRCGFRYYGTDLPKVNLGKIGEKLYAEIETLRKELLTERTKFHNCVHDTEGFYNEEQEENE